MPERFIFREETKLNEPMGHPDGPISGIIHDVEGLRYHLLQEQPKQVVLDAIDGKVSTQYPNGIMQFDSPYQVNINLAELAKNVRIIKPQDIDSPPGIVRAPLTVYFASAAITPRCPIGCNHCYEGEENIGPDTRREMLTEEQINGMLTQFSEEGVFTVRFTGPEVTLNKDLPSWISRTRQLGMSASMNTSGFFNPHMRHRLIQSGLQEAVFSIEGSEQTENMVRGTKIANAYTMAVNNLIALSESGIRTRINMTIGRHNMGEDLDYIVSLASEYCRGGVSLIPLRGLGNANEYMAQAVPDAKDMYQIVKRVVELRSKYPDIPIFTYHDVLDDPQKPALKYHPYQFQKNPCPAAGNVYVTVTGLVVGCCQTMSLQTPDGKGFYFGEGDMTKTRLSDIWKNDPGLNRFRSIQISDECQNCPVYGIRCEGGCPTEYFTSVSELQDGTGTIKATGRDRLCIIKFSALNDNLDNN